MDGIRNGQSYEKIRENMATTSRHKRGYNQFLFPSDKGYGEIFKDSYHTDIELSQDDKPYHIDENH